MYRLVSSAPKKRIENEEEKKIKITPAFRWNQILCTNVSNAIPIVKGIGMVGGDYVNAQ